MKIKPLHAIVAIKVDEPEEYKGSIFVPTFAREELDIGTVVGAGRGETDNKGKFTPNPVKEGDRVLIAKGAGVKMDIDGEELLFVAPNEITGIVRE